jgi:hypothetical protein
VNAAVDFAAEQSGRLQNAEVLGDGGKRDVERGGKLGDGGFAERQARENGAAGGIGKRAESGVEKRFGGQRIVNHMV